MPHPMVFRALALLALLTACGGGGGGGGGGGTTPPPAKAPNIVFILTDDLNRAASFEMSQVKALIADPGASFENHFVSLSLCCPSRVSGLRGQFAHNTGIFRNGPPDGGFAGTFEKGLEISTAATWLKAAGYRTALFGKYLNGYPSADALSYIPPGWTEWFSPNGGTPYKEFDYSLNENGRTVSYGATEADYLTDVISAKAQDFIRRSVDEHPEQPFFAYISTYAPHSPATPAPRHVDAYPGVQAPRGPAFNEADVSDKPAWVQAQPVLTEAQIADLDRGHRRRLQSLLAVDDMVKAVVATLEAKGQLANTYIFFTSDNGFHQGQHRLESGKMTAFEEDLWVPLWVRGPGVAGGRKITQLTANVDYAATFAEMAGASIPDWVDGRSLFGLMKGQTPASWRQVLLLEHKSDVADGLSARPDLSASALAGTREPPDAFDLTLGGGGAGITSFLGLRTADGLTYVAYDSAEFEIYDKLSDASQVSNSYASTSADVKAKLAGWLAALKSAGGASLRQAETTPP